jgi:hypothetical protein
MPPRLLVTMITAVALTLICQTGMVGPMSILPISWNPSWRAGRKNIIDDRGFAVSSRLLPPPLHAEPYTSPLELDAGVPYPPCSST